MNLTLYVYFNDVVIFVAQSRNFLSKVTGVSPAILTRYSSGKTEKLYGKFVITRDLPSDNVLFHLLDEKEVRTIFEKARKANPNKAFFAGVPTIITDTLNENKVYIFDSYEQAAKFTNTYSDRKVTRCTLRKVLLKNKIHKGWLFSHFTTPLLML